MSTEGRFTSEEYTVAGIGGSGIILLVIGGMLAGFGTVEGDATSLMMFAGTILLVLGFVLWLAMLRPWEKFDDLQEGYYTGHDDHHADDHHDADHADHHGTDSAHAEAVAVQHSSEGENLKAVAEPVAQPMVTTGSTDQAVDVIEDADARHKAISDMTDAHHEAAGKTDGVASPLAEVKAEAPAEPKVEPKPAEVPAEPKAETQAEAVPAQKPVETKTASGEPDDLRRIEGIGPKTAEALNAEGITTFAQIAKMTSEELETIVKEKHKVRILAGATESWAKQAQYFVDGDMDGLAEYQATLKGGRGGD